MSLASARELASECRAQVAAGLDPIEARDAAAEIKPEKPTFGAIADALIAAKESEWRNEKHRAQWRASLMEFAAPLRCRPVDEIDTAAVLAVLTPLWQMMPETASRLRGRIEAVLDAAKAQGHRSGENPATDMARPPLAPLAEAREAYARPSCRDGLSGRSCFRRSVARVQRDRRNGEGFQMKVSFDFARVNAAALAALPAVLSRLLSGGKFDGREFVALNPRRNDTGRTLSRRTPGGNLSVLAAQRLGNQKPSPAIVFRGAAKETEESR